MKTPSTEEARKKMLELNVIQKDFYESRFDANQAGAKEERAANKATNFWTRLRHSINHARRNAGVEELLWSLHKEWMSGIASATVLDLGCFDGNYLSLWIAENCRDYTGCDLSEQAIAILNTKLKEKGLDSHARAISADFLANSFADNTFDLVYAYSVLHHFEDINVVLSEIQRVLKPGGLVISMDPLQTDPANWTARRLYRPFQTDKAWEWPFTAKTIRTFKKHFELVDVQGLQGMVKIGYPLQVLPGVKSLGRYMTRMGLEYDKRFARRLGIPFYLCWHASMLLRKRAE